MQTECISGQFEFEGFDGRRVVAAFDGGAVTSDGGGLLLREADRAIGLIERVAACFVDEREQDQVVHTLPALVGQRIVGIALGYEDVNDHDELRHDPVLALFADRLEPKRKDCAPLAGKSTLNRLEHAPLRPATATTRSATTRRRRRPVRRSVPGGAPAAAEADRPRSRRHRRSAARPAGGAVLPRLLRLLLLPAALRVLRPASARGEAAALEHRRLGRRGGRGGAHRRAHPRSLAAGADLAPRRLGLRPRGADGVVRERTGSTTSSASPATRAWSPSSTATWPGPTPSMQRPASRRGASRSSATRRWTAGAVRGG